MQRLRSDSILLILLFAIFPKIQFSSTAVFSASEIYLSLFGQDQITDGTNGAKS